MNVVNILSPLVATISLKRIDNSLNCIAQGLGIITKTHIILPNVPDDRSPPAFGTKGCSAADVPKVPQAW